jgi:hypothetical protein
MIIVITPQESFRLYQNESFARELIIVFSVIQHEHTIDKQVFDTFAVLMGIGYCGFYSDVVQIKNNDICLEAFLDPSSVLPIHDVCCQGCLRADDMGQGH